VFVRDLLLGTTTLVSRNAIGASASGNSAGWSISADGRFVAFSSAASDLPGDDGDGWTDAFVADLVSGTIELVSAGDAPAPAAGLDVVAQALSADGRHVLLEASGAGLIGGDTDAASDVFLYDRQLGQTTCMSVDDSGAEIAGNCEQSSMSADAKVIGFSESF